MKNKELFDRTIGILVKAYLKGELNAMDCAACACGNLVAGNMGYDILNSAFYNGDNRIPEAWGRTCTSVSPDQIRSTGYSLDELGTIEQSFMAGCRIVLSPVLLAKADQDHFAGLMAVCDTLMTIHEANADEIQAAKSLFVLTA